MTAFWDTAPFNLVEVERRFRDAYCHFLQGSSLIALMMEAICTSGTSAYFKESTQRDIPEGCNFLSFLY
jgi:hypothetical protein